ncbi:transcriptional regulator [Halobacteriales archaeon SW_7_68_16]|nr:MAG: transcriptional regulator [Halobacteriales archaeon SW_7_68_16]
MAKYSTGGSSGAGGTDTCELCGAASDSLEEANVAGARLQVCPSCAPHDDNAHKDEKGDDDAADRRDRAVSNASRETSSMWDGDTSHWETEGTNYDRNQLPYLVSDYGDRVREARQEAGLQRGELAGELGAREADIIAVEQGRATQAGIGGDLVEAIEERLNVEISES